MPNEQFPHTTNKVLDTYGISRQYLAQMRFGYRQAQRQKKANGEIKVHQYERGPSMEKGVDWEYVDRGVCYSDAGWKKLQERLAHLLDAVDGILPADRRKILKLADRETDPEVIAQAFGLRKIDVEGIIATKNKNKRGVKHDRVERRGDQNGVLPG